MCNVCRVLYAFVVKVLHLHLSVLTILALKFKQEE